MQVSHSTAAGYARTYITLASCTAHARASASLPRVGLRLYLACFTPVAPVARAYETSFDPPVALHVAAAFRWSRNCAKAADGELQLICILAFSRHNF